MKTVAELLNLELIIKNNNKKSVFSSGFSRSVKSTGMALFTLLFDSLFFQVQ